MDKDIDDADIDSGIYIYTCIETYRYRCRCIDVGIDIDIAEYICGLQFAHSKLTPSPPLRSALVFRGHQNLLRHLRGSQLRQTFKGLGC